MRAMIIACGLITASPAAAETIHMVGTFPALAREFSSARTLAIDHFGGRDGETLAQAIGRRLEQRDAERPAHYALVEANEPADAALSGDVRTTIDHDDYTTERSRCAEKQKGKCVRHEKYEVACRRRTIAVTADLRGMLTRDRRIAYAVTKPRSDTDSWCDDDAPSHSVREVVDTMIESIAAEVRTDIAPHTDSYGIRIREGRDHMPKPLADRFKAAVKLTNHDPEGGCAAFRDLANTMPDHPSIGFNVALCAEAAGDYDGAADGYAHVRLLMPTGGGDIDKGIERIRGLRVARADAAIPRN